MAWVCPGCGKNDRLQVSILTSANLTQDDDNFETEVEGDHEWDNDSTMWCTACGHTGTSGQYDCNLPIANLQHPDGPMPEPRTRRHTDV